MSRAHLALGVAGAAIIVAGIACGEGTYLFLGRRYAIDRDCLQTTTSLDVLRGEDPGNCEARCVTAPARDAGADAAPGAARPRDTYVTIMCPPAPAGIEPVDPSDPRCALALAALARKDTCLADGGSTSPNPTPADASAADASAD